MDRTRARVLASAFHSATVWIGCALGACLTAGCASPGQLSESSGRGSPPACACQSNVARAVEAQEWRQQSGGSSSPHTVGQAWRAYVDCLHSPLSRRGPAMNVEEGRGDTGVSRYPPAGGERYPQRGPAMNVGEGRGDTGVSSFPPAEGERNVPAEAPRPPSGPSQPRTTAPSARRAQRLRLARERERTPPRAKAEPTGREAICRRRQFPGRKQSFRFPPSIRLACCRSSLLSRR